MKQDEPQKKQTRQRWHQVFGQLLDLMLQPVDISVFLELEVLSAPPKADVLLLRNNQPQWTEAQREVLPDGIRDTTAGHIMMEFKYTESFNEAAVSQALVYDYLYKAKTRLGSQDVQTFLVCSKTPQAHSLKLFGYQSVQEGVYTSPYKLVEHLDIPQRTFNPGP